MSQPESSFWSQRLGLHRPQCTISPWNTTQKRLIMLFALGGYQTDGVLVVLCRAYLHWEATKRMESWLSFVEPIYLSTCQSMCLGSTILQHTLRFVINHSCICSPVYLSFISYLPWLCNVLAPGDKNLTKASPRS